jgi:predicted metal-dependent phosphoesterase TrpH
LIDLHAHSDASDGSYSPSQLVEEACAIGLEALSLTDHDTLSGYDQAVPPARAAGLDLVCGIELSTKLRMPNQPRPRTVHLLGYFLARPPSPEFRGWLSEIQESRRDRNRRLVAKLRSFGLDITLEEVQALGRALTGRPHFAKVLVQKKYVSNIQEAFDVYLDESAKAYVDRKEPSFSEGVRRICEAGGLPALPHPNRLAKRKPDAIDTLLRIMVDQGLRGIEVYHSDHTPADVERYFGLSQRYGLAVTGGSDFHGDAKPGVRLGTGTNGNLSVPREVLDRLRELDLSRG